MENEGYKELLLAITNTLLPIFLETKKEMREKPENDFVCGRAQAYYEVLDTFKNRIMLYGYNPDEFGFTEDTIAP